MSWGGCCHCSCNVCSCNARLKVVKKLENSGFMFQTVFLPWSCPQVGSGNARASSRLGHSGICPLQSHQEHGWPLASVPIFAIGTLSFIELPYPLCGCAPAHLDRWSFVKYLTLMTTSPKYGAWSLERSCPGISMVCGALYYTWQVLPWCSVSKAHCEVWTLTHKLYRRYWYTVSYRTAIQFCNRKWLR